jgi:hypothetical protein
MADFNFCLRLGFGWEYQLTSETWGQLSASYFGVLGLLNQANQIGIVEAIARIAYDKSSH